MAHWHARHTVHGTPSAIQLARRNVTRCSCIFRPARAPALSTRPLEKGHELGAAPVVRGLGDQSLVLPSLEPLQALLGRGPVHTAGKVPRRRKGLRDVVHGHVGPTRAGAIRRAWATPKRGLPADESRLGDFGAAWYTEENAEDQRGDPKNHQERQQRVEVEAGRRKRKPSASSLASSTSLMSVSE